MEKVFHEERVLKNICIITNKYPNPIEPNVLVFVQQLVWTMADLRMDCTVICPMPININPSYAKFPNKIIEQTENGNLVTVYLPKYIGFGQSDILGFNPARITTKLFTHAVSRVINDMKTKPDAVYGHFVTPAGIAAARIGKKYKIPSFMAHGEATFMTIDHFGKERVAKELESLNGVVAVSTQNKNMLTSINAVAERKIEVFPNGFRKERFFPRNRTESRRKFDLPEDAFIISFVGSFDNRKGIERLMEAVNNLDNVYVICAGSGELKPSSNRCLYSDPVKNEDLPFFYSASDAFVLPTLNEGCCNAIIEAMACGLPIVSSDLSFNDDILDDSCSIRVNPKDITEISNAITELKNNEVKLKKLGEGSLLKAKGLTLSSRSSKIIGFLEKMS